MMAAEACEESLWFPNLTGVMDESYYVVDQIVINKRCCRLRCVSVDVVSALCSGE